MRPPTRLAVSAAVLVAAVVLLQFRSVGEGVPMRRSFESFPQTIGSWKGEDDMVLDAEVLRMLKSSDYVMRRYVDEAGHSAWLYMAYWQSQRKGADIHSPRNCLPGGGWEPIETKRLTIPVAGPTGSITVNSYLIQKDRHLQVVIYWFQAQGVAMAGELDAKIQMVRSAVLKNRTDGAIIRLSSPVSGSVRDTTDRLVAYIQTLHPILSTYLPD
jgi:EpsI family protein